MSDCLPGLLRFFRLVERTPSCWVWRGARHTNGYGWFWWGSRAGSAHLFSYRALVGPIPDGLTLDHLCRNRACVNPDHLEAVTMRVNILRGTAMSARHARKELCPRGHEYAHIQRGAYHARRCRSCCRQYMRDFRARQKATQ